MKPRDMVSRFVKLLPWAYDERRTPERSAARKAHIMDDVNAGGFCEHCGAVWDDAHEQGGCGVADATSRILAGHVPRVPTCYKCGTKHHAEVACASTKT